MKSPRAPRLGCCKFSVAWHLCSRQIYCSRLPGLGRSAQATLLRRSGGMRRMSRAYHASREEGRSLSDGEERPYASMYLQQFAPFWNNSKLLARPTLQHPTPRPMLRFCRYNNLQSTVTSEICCIGRALLPDTKTNTTLSVFTGSDGYRTRCLCLHLARRSCRDAEASRVEFEEVK